MSPKVLIAWFFIASAYVMAFMQRMAPQSINAALMADFELDAASVSWLTAGYFWGYALMQIPAGPLVDLFGIRRMAIISLTVSLVSTLGFALSTDMSVAFGFRFLLATGDALVFTILIKLVAQNFSDAKFGLMTGLSQSSGYLGGVLASAPLAFLVGIWGWQHAFMAIAVVCLINLVGVWCCLRESQTSQKPSVSAKTILAVVRRHAKNTASWGCAMANSSHFVMVSILAGVWGLPMVAHTFAMDFVAAGQPLALFMAGNVIGSIFIGHFIDKSTRLVAVMVAVYAVRLVLIVLLAPELARYLGFGFLLVNFLLLGVISGGVVPVVLKCVRQVYTPGFMGTGASLSMTVAGLATVLLLSLLGLGMDVFAVAPDGGIQVATSLGDDSYNFLIAFLLATGMVGIVGAWMIHRNPRPLDLAPQEHTS